ncbi:MAG TPA: histidine kinase dimerization/phosphoacceptor domain -containing protein [Candidatus Limnocylindrales bacterium]|nr:histidine kinase dimerization/phosphoacceptor domain -containing protein [Candidatus Limnocylindrales bacterium]
MITRKLAIKWSFILAIFLIVSLITLFIFTSTFIWQTATERTQEKFEKGFIRLEAMFERILQENLERALFLSQDEEKLLQPLQQKNYLQLQRNLETELKKRVAINLMLITDNEGHLVTQVPGDSIFGLSEPFKDTDLMEFIEQALKGEAARRILISPSDFVLAVAVPIKIGNQIIGTCLIGSRITPQVIESYSRIIGLGIGIYFRGSKVLGSYKGLASLPDSLTFDTFQTFLIDQEKFDVAFKQAMRYSQPGSWILAGILPYHEREAMVRNEQKVLLMLIVGIHLILIGLIFFGFRSLVRPILRLTEASREIARGKWQGRVPETSRRDEIGELARSFEQMILQRKQVEDSLIEQTREMHHRIKNNLQMISSLLQLQLRRKNIQDPEALIRSTLERIQNIALTHEFLSCREKDSIHALDLLGRIGEACLKTLVQSNQTIEISVTGQDILMNSTTALPLAFITHELVVNAIKHGFKNRDKGLIQIHLIPEGSRVILRIQDDGQGLPEESPASQDFYNLGLQLVQRFVSRDLKGTFHLSKNLSQGTTAQIVFEP